MLSQFIGMLLICNSAIFTPQSEDICSVVQTSWKNQRAIFDTEFRKHIFIFQRVNKRAVNRIQIHTKIQIKLLPIFELKMHYKFIDITRRFKTKSGFI